jgi:ABC-type glycerol-3-phosphate transport system substrate-binding protein
LALSILIAIGFSACAPTPTSAPTETISEISAEPVVITFATDQFNTTYYENLARDFNAEHSTISVQIVSVDYLSEFWEADNLRSLASLADTVIYDGDRSKLIEHPEYFLDLSSLIDATADFDAVDFWGDSIAKSQDEAGRIIGLPLSLGLMGIFYNSEGLTDLGVSLPEPGWTIDELQDLLGQNDLTLQDFGLSYSVISPLISHTIAQNDGEINSADLARITQWYVDLSKSGNISSGNADAKPNLWAGPMNSDDLLTGRANAMASYAFAPYPVLSDDEQDVPTNIIFPIYGLISAGSEHPREAWQWLNYLSHQPPGYLITDTIPYAISARQSVAEENFPWEMISRENQDAIRYALEHGWLGSNHPQAFQAVTDALTQVLAGEISLESAFTALSISPAPTPDPEPIVLSSPEDAFEALFDSDATVVHFYLPGSLVKDANIYETLISEFENTHPDVKIDFQSEFTWPGGNAFPYLIDKFDCFYWGEGASPASALDYVADLSPFIEGETADFFQDFYPHTVEAFTSDGQIYALPVTSSLELIKYNSALLNELGIDPPDPNWPFDDLLRLLAEIAEKTQDQELYASTGLEKYLLYGFGAQFYDLNVDPADIRINSPEAQQAFQLVVDMINHREIYYPETYDYTVENQLRDNGQIVLWLSSTSSRITSPLDEGVLPLPAIDANFYGIGWSNPQALYISAESDVKQACWDWIRFLSDQPNIFDSVPVRKSILSSPSYAAAVGDDLAAVYKISMANATFRGGINVVTRPIDGWVTQSLQSLVAGENPEIVLTDAQWKAENFVDCLAEHNLTHEVIYTISTENTDVRVQIGACALEVDPDFVTTYGYE